MTDFIVPWFIPHCGQQFQIAPCRLQGWKNRPAPFPGRMSYKVTKPGSALYLSLGYFECVCCAVSYGYFLHCVICVFFLLVVLVRLSVLVQVIDWKDSSPKW